MKLLIVPFRVIYCIYALITFLITMFLVLPFVVIASFFGRIRGGNMIYRICCFWADIWLPIVGIFHRNIYDRPHDPQQTFIFVANHISYLDAPIIVKTIRQRVRVLGKSEMNRIPFFGFIYRNAIVTVDRKSAEHRARSVRILKSTVKKGISIFLFPEGTFNETRRPMKEFYDGAFRIAIETRTPIKPLLFLDAYDRMHYRSVFSLNPGRSRTVYLDAISVEEYTLKDVPALKQKVYDIMCSKLEEYGASWVQSNEYAVSATAGE